MQTSLIRRGAGRLGLIFVLTLLALGTALPASAHSAEESYVYLEIYDDTIEGRVEFPVSDLAEAIGVDLPEQDSGLLSEAVSANLARIHAYTVEHLVLENNGDNWGVEPQGFEIFGENSLFVIVPFVIGQTFDPVPREFTVTYTGIIEAKPERRALLLIGSDWRAGTFNNESDHLLIYSSDSPTQLVDLGATSTLASWMGTIELGVEHIQIGSDHILFVLSLLLPSVLVFRRGAGWMPVDGFAAGLWRILKIATSFTVAHTITLTLGGLGYISLSPDFVEPVIAMSIALAALHNLRPVAVNKEWVLAFGFGLFHGFGFAGLLADLGLDRANRFVSLLGFNLGIEVGQVVIILLVFPALFLLRRTRAYIPLMSAGSLALIAIGVGWFIDRVFGLDLGVDRLVEPVLVWPRPILISALLTLVAGLAYMVEKSRGHLVPIASEPESVEEKLPAGV